MGFLLFFLFYLNSLFSLNQQIMDNHSIFHLKQKIIKMIIEEHGVQL